MPRDEDTVTRDGNFLDRIPQDIRGTFTDRQIAAVNQAFKSAGHGIDIRVSLPLPGGRRYLVLLMGKERRSPERRRFERLQHPLRTAIKVVTMATFGALVVIFAVGLVQIMFR